MKGCLVVLTAVLPFATVAAAQDFPRVETAPGFMYIHTTPFTGLAHGINCAGFGGTIAVNVTSAFGLAADLGFCKSFSSGINAVENGTVNGSGGTYLFGPRFTFRNSSRLTPFVEVSGGIVRAKMSCANGNIGTYCNSTGATQLPAVLRPGFNPSDTSVSTNAPAFSIGGGLDIKINKKVAIRLFQAEYLYTAFGNDCKFAVCNTGTDNSQNSFRLKSGIVVRWGGERPGPTPPPAPPPTKACWDGSNVPVSQECPKRSLALSLSVPQSELCQGSTVTITPEAGVPGNATYQWTVDGQPISKAAALEFGTNGLEPRTYKVSLTAGADGYNDATAGTVITVQPYRPPTESLDISPSEIWFGEKATVAARVTPGQCGGALGTPVVSASEGSVADNVFDSSSVQFDPSEYKEQRKTVKIVANVSDQKGSIAAETKVVVKKKATAKRLPDIVFPEGNSRVNNCGKRVLLEELKTYTDNDPTGNVILVGHIGERESSAAGLDQKRALNAAAVISSGQGVCSNFAASRILVGLAGSTEPGGDFQSYFCGTSTTPRTLETAGNQVNESDLNAKYRRVEVWFVPTGGEPPAFPKGYKDAASLSVASLGCPR